MLPLDIELEIIKSLPVKSLIRFMSVCKAWKSFISCSEFVAGYRALPTQPHHLLINYELGYKKENDVKYVCFVDDDDTFPQQKLHVPPIVQLLEQCRIINSSCGLLCLNGFFREPDNSATDMVVLWNPSIRKSVSVGVPNAVHRPFSYVVGFGVCPYTMDPKLVKVTYIDRWQETESISGIPRQVEVFTLSSGEWKFPCSNLPRKSISFIEFHVVIGQFIYWLAYDKINNGDDRHNLIMSFDLRTEEFREIELPDSLTDTEEDYDEHLYIFRRKESLAVVEHVGTDSPYEKVCHVWMMDHSKAFSKIFTIDVPNMSVSGILGFTKSGEPIVDMRDAIKNHYPTCALVVYEPFSEYIKDLGIRGDEYSFFGSSYTESLLLLDHDDGQIVRC